MRLHKKGCQRDLPSLENNAYITSYHTRSIRYHPRQTEALSSSSQWISKRLSFLSFSSRIKLQVRPRMVEWNDYSMSIWKTLVPVHLGSLCLHSCQLTYPCISLPAHNIWSSSSSWQGAGMAQAPHRGRANPKLVSGCCWDCTGTT